MVELVSIVASLVARLVGDAIRAGVPRLVRRVRRKKHQPTMRIYSTRARIVGPMDRDWPAGVPPDPGDEWVAQLPLTRGSAAEKALTMPRKARRREADCSPASPRRR